MDGSLSLSLSLLLSLSHLVQNYEVFQIAITERTNLLKVNSDQLSNWLHCNPDRINSLLACYNLAYLPAVNTICDRSSISVISPASVMMVAEQYKQYEQSERDGLKHEDPIPASSAKEKPIHWIETLSWEELNEVSVDMNQLKNSVPKEAKSIRVGKHIPYGRIDQRIR